MFLPIRQRTVAYPKHAPIVQPITIMIMEELIKKVKEKIIITFGELMPEEEFAKVITNEINNYFKDRTSPYNSREIIESKFKKDVREAVNEFMKGKIKEYLDSEEMQLRWNENGQKIIPKAIEDMIANNSTKILNSLLETMIANVLYSINAYNK